MNSEMHFKKFPESNKCSNNMPWLVGTGFIVIVHMRLVYFFILLKSLAWTFESCNRYKMLTIEHANSVLCVLMIVMYIPFSITTIMLYIIR